jgi:hypothetical protein
MRTVFSNNSILQTIIKNKDDQTGIETEPLDSLLVSVAVPHIEVYDERITFDIIKINRELAMVWAHYKFYVGARLNHCGVDSFQLVKINGEWKIQYLIDTRRRQGCE